MKRFLLNCEQASLFVLKNEDRLLSAAEKRGLKVHLFLCKKCRLFFIHNLQIDRCAKQISIGIQNKLNAII